MRRVTVNGCFDGLHPGHMFMLGYAAAQGDELIVGINSDEYIQKRKGMVMHKEQERREALMDLGFIHSVHVFHEMYPILFLSRIMPDVHCTGAEYANGTCAEAQWCELWDIKLVYVPRVGKWSSSAIRSKIRRELECGQP